MEGHTTSPEEGDPLNRMASTLPRPATMQLCPYMVATRLMTLLSPGQDTPTESYPLFTEEDMPGIQRCFFSTREYLQQTHPHVLELKSTPPRITHLPTQLTQRNLATTYHT